MPAAMSQKLWNDVMKNWLPQNGGFSIKDMLSALHFLMLTM
jgi:hypothetical protein